MIERFNFYDVYGYFIPGVCLIGIAWVPFGFVWGKWPPTELANAVLFGLAAYVTGMVFQSLAASVLPSNVLIGGKRRYPSDFLLDSDDKRLSPTTKSKILANVKVYVADNLALEADANQINSTITSSRNTAFNQVRTLLRISSEKSYAEQFQGLYSMTRSLTLIFWLLTVYFLGWALPSFAFVNGVRNYILVADILAVVVFCLLGLRDRTSRDRKQSNQIYDRLLVGAISLLSFFLAYGASSTSNLSSFQRRVLFLCAVFLFVSMCRFYGAYRGFAVEFAQSVWNDFAVYKPPSKA